MSYLGQSSSQDSRACILGTPTVSSLSCYSKQEARCNLRRLCCPGLQNAKEGMTYTSQHLWPQSRSRTWHTGTTGRPTSHSWACTCPAHSACTGHYPSCTPAGTRGQHSSPQSTETGTRIASRMIHAGHRADDTWTTRYRPTPLLFSLTNFFAATTLYRLRT